jgi:hypothetical protein
MDRDCQDKREGRTQSDELTSAFCTLTPSFLLHPVMINCKPCGALAALKTCARRELLFHAAMLRYFIRY